MESGSIADDDLTQRPESLVFSVWYLAPGATPAPPERDVARLLDDEDGVSDASPEALAATVQPPKPRGRPRLSSREVVFFTGRALIQNSVAELVLHCPKPLMSGNSNKKISLVEDHFFSLFLCTGFKCLPRVVDGPVVDGAHTTH